MLPAADNLKDSGPNKSVFYSNMHDYGVQCEATIDSSLFPPLPISPAISPVAKQPRTEAPTDTPSIDGATATILKEFSAFSDNINKRLDTLQSMLKCNY